MGETNTRTLTALESAIAQQRQLVHKLDQQLEAEKRRLDTLLTEAEEAAMKIFSEKE